MNWSLQAMLEQSHVVNPFTTRGLHVINKNECECLTGVSRHWETDEIVSRCLETPVKHDAQVFDMASKTIHTSFSN